MGRDKGWLTPLAGVLFLVLAIIAFAISGEPPDASKDSAREVVDFYVDNKGTQTASAFITGLAGVALVFFGAALREALRLGEGEREVLPTAAFAGTVILAMGLAIDGTIALALAETADDLEPGSVQALNALYNNDFIPFAVGSLLFLLSTGLSILRSRVLPKWIAWVALLLALLNVTPLGFVSFIGSIILAAVIGAMLAMRDRAKPAAA